MTQYTDILSMPRSEIKEPQPLPLGTYNAVVKETPRFDKGGKNNNDFAEFLFTLTAAEPDVDPDALVAAGGLPKEHKHTFWLTAKSAFIANNFLTAAGIPDTGNTLGEDLMQTVGRAVKVSIVLGKASVKTGKQYPEISGFAAA